jgi:DNA polymerase III gamma/tau subunit
MSLQIQYRPSSFKTFVGNEEVKKSLIPILKREDPPSAFLFTGPSGSGKTTLARIIRKALKCSPSDWKELNAADDRGIDGIRKLIESMKFMPLSGEKKVFLLDECFSACTLISTPEGQKRIDSIKVNDTVFNLNGIDIVEKVFVNKVSLDRVIKINKSDGTYTFCSQDHKYYLDGKWIKAKDLTNMLLVKYSEPMININSLYEVQNDLQKNMSILQRGISSEEENGDVLFKKLFHESQVFFDSEEIKNLQVLRKRIFSKEKIKQILFSKLFSILPRSAERKASNSIDRMFNVQRGVSSKFKKSNILFYKLFKKVCKELSNEQTTHRRNEKEDKHSSTEILSNRSRRKSCTKIIGTHEEKQPDEYFWSERESNRNKKNKWNSSCLERKAWRDWAVDRTAEIIDVFIRMGSRITYQNSRSFAYETTGSLESQKRNSYIIQSGFRKPKTKNCNRDRWERAQFNSEKETGQKERVISEMERVESIEIYKRGSNDESFASIIGYKERNQGFVEFYDLQIKENHSYIANKNMVHNCHMLTKPSQEALLKALEEPPGYVHWIICTTNPEALKTTFKRRCHTYELEPLKDAELHKLIKMILKKEKRTSVSMEVRERILELADGSAGQALKLLDQVIDMDDKDAAIRTLQSAGTSESEVIEICRTLVNDNMPQKTKWAKTKTLLKNYKGDGESARRPILGYLNSVLLNNGDSNIFFMMQPFKNNFYDSGKAGLSMALYQAIFDYADGGE